MQSKCGYGREMAKGKKFYKRSYSGRNLMAFKIRFFVVFNTKYVWSYSTLSLFENKRNLDGGASGKFGGAGREHQFWYIN